MRNIILDFTQKNLYFTINTHRYGKVTTIFHLTMTCRNFTSICLVSFLVLFVTTLSGQETCRCSLREEGTCLSYLSASSLSPDADGNIPCEETTCQLGYICDDAGLSNCTVDTTQFMVIQKVNHVNGQTYCDTRMVQGGTVVEFYKGPELSYQAIATGVNTRPESVMTTAETIVIVDFQKFFDGCSVFMRMEKLRGNYSSAVTKASLHGPADRESTSVSILTIFDDVRFGQGLENGYAQEFSEFLEDASVCDILESELSYVNIATIKNPNGETRGQFEKIPAWFMEESYSDASTMYPHESGIFLEPVMGAAVGSTIYAVDFSNYAY